MDSDPEDILAARYPADKYRLIRLALPIDQFEWLLARSLYDDVAPSDLVQGLINMNSTYQKRKH